MHVILTAGQAVLCSSSPFGEGETFLGSLDEDIILSRAACAGVCVSMAGGEREGDPRRRKSGKSEQRNRDVRHPRPQSKRGSGERDA